MSSRFGRIARNAAAVLVAAGLIAGSLFWGDDAWPFAPFRMFARGTKNTVWALALEGDRADGRSVRVPFEAVHLRRAEVEGQFTRVVAHPDLLRDLMDVYNRKAPSARRLRALRLVERRAPVVAGRPVRSGGSRASGRRRPGPPREVEWRTSVIAQWPL